jgi:hypothetical protein
VNDCGGPDIPIGLQIATEETAFVDNVRPLEVSRFDGAMSKWGMPPRCRLRRVRNIQVTGLDGVDLERVGVTYDPLSTPALLRGKVTLKAA